MNRERIEKLRNFLRDQVPDAKFNMNHWVYGGDCWLPIRQRMKDCGTAACIGGWAVERFLPTSKQYSGTKSTEERATDLLGLDKDTASELFAPTHIGPLSSVPRARAVATLTHLLETGEVVWDLPETASLTPTTKEA